MEEEIIEETIEEEEKKYAYVVPVKFHNSTKPYSFGTDSPDFDTGDYVVVETIQGMEMGIVQAPSLSTEKFPSRHPLRPIIRLASEDDKAQYEENFQLAKDAFKVCEEEIAELGLNMHLLSSSYLLDRSKVLFVYTAEARVDFRELLKHLGSRLHCRIELRQIGERDQAKLVGGIGLCGMECCCSRFKSRFDNISINMAKTQQLALNIEKLSGMCGKLMCCLKYENDIYAELNEGLPKIGAHVEYEGELYRVSSINLISKEAKIDNSSTYLTISTDELRDKAIVRKGVTIKKDPDEKAPKVVRKIKEDITTKNIPTSDISKEQPKPSVEKRTFKKNDQNVEKREFKKSDQKPKQETRTFSAKNNNNRRSQQPKPVENKGNITVRSFKAKKAEKDETPKEL